MNWDSICPRFTFYYGKKYGSGRPVFWMRKKEWSSLGINSTERAVIKAIESLPISKTISEATVIVIDAFKQQEHEFILELYRDDPKDPKPINVDKYLILENIHLRPEYCSIISSASTSNTPSLRKFLSEHVAFIKEQHDTNHWLDELPKEIKLLIKKG